MGNIRMILFDGCDYITLHDLHMINIVEQLEVFRTQLFAKFHSPRGMVALIIRVINLAVQQFHYNIYLILLGYLHNRSQSLRTILKANCI